MELFVDDDDANDNTEDNNAVLDPRTTADCVQLRQYQSYSTLLACTI